MPRAISPRDKYLKDLFRSKEFRDDFREILGAHDLELLYDDEEKNEPISFVSKMADQCYYIRFKPFFSEGVASCEGSLGVSDD